jgi:hypothetical protein
MLSFFTSKYTHNSPGLRSKKSVQASAKSEMIRISSFRAIRLLFYKLKTSLVTHAQENRRIVMRSVDYELISTEDS